MLSGVRVEPYRPYHLQLMMAQGDIQEGQRGDLSYVPAGLARVFRIPGQAMAVIENEDKVLLCGGIIPEGPTSGLMWAVLAKSAGRHMTFLHRGVLRFIDMQGLRRIEATVEKGFGEGCRWLALMGFKYEGDMEAFGVDGKDHERWARVRR
jgi:hypothetical protein